MYRRFLFPLTAAVGLAAALVAFPAAAITDTMPPTMGVITPSSLYKNVAVTFSSDVSDDISGVDYCSLRIDGIDQGLMTLTPITGGYRATKSYTYTGTAASISVKVACTDRAAVPNSDSRTQTMTVLVDVQAPNVGAVTPTVATAGAAVTYSVTATDNVGITVCKLLEGGVGYTMTLGAGTATYAADFSVGVHNLQGECQDAAGTWGMGPVTAVTVSAPAPVDVTAPAVGAIAQATATAGTALTLSATATDAVGVASCTLYVNDASVGAMTVAGGSASRSYTFAAAGSYGAYVRCADAAGNAAVGVTQTIVVAAASAGGTCTGDADCDDLADIDEALYGTGAATSDSDHDGATDGSEVRNGTNPTGSGALPAPTGAAVPGRLIKLACPVGATVYDPCKAVYYYGRDNKRHAFPNERIYRTWFNSFAGVQTVSASVIASLPVGQNVLFRPGVRLVKFQTVNTVYAVSRGGTLHAVASEAIAASLYGGTWAANVSDVSDVLYGDFVFGTDVASAAAFVPADETKNTTAIDANF